MLELLPALGGQRLLRTRMSVRQHDPYGPFRVEFPNPDHPVARGMAAFDTQDKLYTCLTSGHPIEVIAQAKSPVDGAYYPMAFVSNYGNGRTFHCTLGHDVKALSVRAVQELFIAAVALGPVAWLQLQLGPP